MRRGAEIRRGGQIQGQNTRVTEEIDDSKIIRVPISDALSKAPDSPGSYRFWDDNNRVLYVGKAKSVRARLRSHLSSARQTYRHQIMVERSRFIDWIIVPNEVEALILEDALIKKHRPQFNVLFRDDKRYPILRLDVRDAFPGLTVVRRFQKDGAVYYGPFTSGRSMRTVLYVIEKFFPIRQCSGPVKLKSERACLNFEIGRCPGLCIGKVTHEEYMETIRHIRLLLEGRSDELIVALQKKMMDYSSGLEFEQAGVVRDQIHAIHRVTQGRKIWLNKPEDIDVFAFMITGESAIAALLFVRSGIISGKSRQKLDIPMDCSFAEIAYRAITHHYSKGAPVVPVILTTHLPEDSAGLANQLSELGGHRVVVYTPQRGQKKKLLQLARANLKIYLHSTRSTAMNDSQLSRLQEMLHLRRLPHVIEAIDISESSGKDAVGSIVCFRDGLPDKKHYRRFKIRSPEASDDLSRIQEVIYRRLLRARNDQWPLPDLFLIDGGLNQLKTAWNVLRKFDADAEMISLAKMRNRRTHESVFLSDGRELPLDRAVFETRLLDAIRDEAHRFAIQYHRNVRSRRSLTSRMLAVKGVGPARLKKLLSTFGTFKGISVASSEAIERAAGVNSDTATAIKNAVNEVDNSDVEDDTLGS